MITSHVHSGILGRGCCWALKPILSPQLPVWLSSWGASEAGRMEEGFLSLLLLPWPLTGKAQVVPRAAVGAYLKFCHRYTSWGSNKGQPASPAPAHHRLWVLAAMPLNFTISHSEPAFLPLSSSNTWLTALLVYLYICIILSAKVTGVSSSPDWNLNDTLMSFKQASVSLICALEPSCQDHLPYVKEGKQERLSQKCRPMPCSLQKISQ